MNRYPSIAWIARGLVVLAAAFAVAGAAAPASARIGNPIRKMKDKISKAAESKAAPDASAGQPVFDDVTLELTDARIGGILDAFHKAQKITAARAALVAKKDKASDEQTKIMDKNGEAIGQLRNKRDEVNQCCQDGYRAATDKKAEAYKNRALTDPALRDKFTKAAAEYNAAAAKGDTAAIQKLQGILTGEILPTSEDSAAIRKSCGALPPPSAAEIRLEHLEKEIAALDEQIRQVDEKVADESAGLNRQQWGMALERIQMYLAAKKAKKAPQQFTEEEIKAIEKRLAEIEEAMGM